MKSFSQLGIKMDHCQSGFIGDKIEIVEVFNQPITVYAYKKVPSKFPKPGREICIHMQIEFNGEKRILFVTSQVLMRALDNIPNDDFPFTTTIKAVTLNKNQKRFEFT